MGHLAHGASIDPFHAKVQLEFARAGAELSDLNMQFRTFHLDPLAPLRTAEQITKAISAHDALVICAPYAPEIAAACRKFSARGPVITFATDIPESGRLAYVGPDNQRAGRVAGDLMGRFLGPGGGDVVMIVGLLSMRGHQEREEGFRAVLAERYAACRVAAVVESHEQSKRAGELVWNLLRDIPTIRGIYNASAGAGDVVSSLEKMHRQDVSFITHELTDERRALLLEGRIDAVIDQNPQAEVRLAISKLADAFGRADEVFSIGAPLIQIYTIENS